MKPALDEQYWSERYKTSETGWDLGAPSTPLKTYIDQLGNKELKILIPGAGNAYEAEYLANSGFKHVYVCDLAAEPLANLKARCPLFKNEQLIQGDFFGLENITFDLILEQTFFCALHPALRKQYFVKMHSLLNPNGKLVGLLFNDTLNTDKPPFGGNKDEYQTYFKDMFSVHTCETCYNSIPPRAGRELFVNLLKK